MGDPEPDLVKRWDEALPTTAFEDSIEAAHAFAQEMMAESENEDSGEEALEVLLNLAEAFASQGRHQEALAMVKSLLFPDRAVVPERSELVARALLLQARALHAFGQFAQAQEAFERCSAKALELGNSTGAAIAAGAMFLRARLFEELAGERDQPLIERAISTYEELERTLGQQYDPRVRSLVVQALYNHASLLALLGRPLDAASKFAESLAVADGMAEDELPPHFVAYARLRQRRLASIDVPEAAGDAHFLKIEINNLRLQERYARRKAWTYLVLAPHRARRWRGAAKSLAVHRSRYLVERGVAEEMASLEHARARKLLCETQSTLEPFVLLLRNFDYRLFSRVVPTTQEFRREDPLNRPLRQVVLTANTLSASSVEEDLASSFGRIAPVVSVANTSDLRLDTRSKSDRATLYLGEETWIDTVRGLIGVADVILIRLAFMTPGVVEELEYIEGVGATDRTILVVPDASELESVEAFLEMLSEWTTSKSLLPGPRADPDSLSSRFNVVTDSEIVLGQPGHTPAFAPAVSSLLKIQHMSPSERLRHFTQQATHG